MNFSEWLWKTVEYFYVASAIIMTTIWAIFMLAFVVGIALQIYGGINS